MLHFNQQWLNVCLAEILQKKNTQPVAPFHLTINCMLLLWRNRTCAIRQEVTGVVPVSRPNSFTLNVTKLWTTSDTCSAGSWWARLQTLSSKSFIQNPRGSNEFCQLKCIKYMWTKKNKKTKATVLEYSRWINTARIFPSNITYEWKYLVNNTYSAWRLHPGLPIYLHGQGFGCPV